MFDLLRPVTKAAMVAAFILFFIAANAALLFGLNACIASTTCIGTGASAEVIAMIQKIGGLFLPGNFWLCMQFMIAGYILRRAYDYGVSVMKITAQTS